MNTTYEIIKSENGKEISVRVKNGKGLSIATTHFSVADEYTELGMICIAYDNKNESLRHGEMEAEYSCCR